METPDSDFSLPPQWVRDLYNPDDLPPHVLVSETGLPDTYAAQSVDFHAVNLYEFRLTNLHNLPVKGESRVLLGVTPEELYAELEKIDEKVLITIPVQKRLRDVPNMPIFFGHSTAFSAPSLVNAEYAAFRSAQRSYEEHPDNAGIAYHFVNLHPMFWYVEQREPRRKRDGQPGKARKEVVTGRGFNRLDFEVFVNKDEAGIPKTRVTIETGPGNYHDLNLDVYADSFDEAIVEMAKLIHTHYDSHGGFTDKTKKEPNDNLFRKWDEEDATEEAGTEKD